MLELKESSLKRERLRKEALKLIVQKDDNKYNFVVIKAHKEDFALAERLEVSSFVSVVGIIKFRAIICTQLKQLPKMDESKQAILSFT